MANVLNYFDQADVDGNNTLHLTGNTNVFVPSTTEQKYGTWVDGKTIYRKAVNFGALPNATTKNVAHGITGLNLDNYIKAELIAYKDASSTPLNVPGLCAVTGSAGTVALSIGAANVTVVTSADESAYDQSYAIIYYTKS